MAAGDDHTETAPLFSGFTADELEALTSAGTRRPLAKGDVLCRTGDTDAAMYVIDSGKIAVRRSVRDEEVSLATLKPGETCGEMSLITGRPRTADLIAAADSEVIEISREVLDGLLDAHPAMVGRLWQNVAFMLASRLANTHDLVTEYVGLNRRIVDDPEFRKFYSRL